MIKLFLKIIVLIFVAYLIFVGFSNKEQVPVEEQRIGLPNPASVNCIEKGGELKIQRDERGEYGVCYFDDNRQCEEWAMFRGDCPIGGRRVVGYITEEERFCAIRGGTVNRENCEIGEKICGLVEYYSGVCDL